MTQLPELPANLKILSCSNNHLVGLPILPLGLERLIADGNQLTVLPSLPTTLWDLNVVNNLLSEIPILPEGLIQLAARNNSLETLPPLPNSLYSLNVSDNQLISLPELPDGLEWLWCRGNNIVEIGRLPASLKYLDGLFNNLTCVPIIPPNLWGFHLIEGNNIGCLPNENSYVTSGSTGLPLCAQGNANGCTYFRQVLGSIYFDENENCQKDPEERGLKNRVISSSFGTSTLSDSQGNYVLFTDTGVQTITQHPYNLTWSFDCSNIPYITTLLPQVDSVLGLHFPNQSTQSCHWLRVDVGTFGQRPCFDNNAYTVNYYNDGNQAATGVYVEMQFPLEVTPLSSSVPMQSLGNGLYRFDLQDLDIDEHGAFTVINTVDCDAELGGVVCVSTEIFPHSPCLPVGSGWDQSSVELDGHCITPDSVEFVIRNVGSGNMTEPSSYRLYSNFSLTQDNTSFQLNAGDSLLVRTLISSGVMRMDADQSFGHPGNSLPRAVVEGCSMAIDTMGDFTSFAQNDLDDHIEETCARLTLSYDPNDKTVIPSGYGPNRSISVTDTILEYTIRFQNTGTDTAFDVRITDVLPIQVNPATFISGVSSHPYDVEISGHGVVTWRFNGIELPDSSVDFAGSQGFLKFRIKTNEGLPVGTFIKNEASIYFDFNDAIVTNRTSVMIDEIPVEVSVFEMEALTKRLKLYPNPTNGYLNVQLSDSRLKATTLSVFDMTSREVLRKPFTQRLDVSGLSAGNYVLAVYTNEGVLREKLVVSNR